MSELSPETRAWIAATSTGDAPSAEDRARIRQRLALELGAAALATTTLAVTAQATAASGAAVSSAAVSSAASMAVGKASVGAGLFGKLVVAAAVAGAVSTTAVVALRAPTDARATSATQATPRVVRARTAQAAARPLSEAPAAGPVPVVEQLTEAPEAATSTTVTPKRAATRRADAAPPPAVATTSIGDELVLLRAAQTALREGRVNDALARTSEHAARFPQGALREERTAVEMLAHCTNRSESAEMLRAFLNSAPESPLKARVREACGAE